MPEQPQSGTAAPAGPAANWMRHASRTSQVAFAGIVNGKQLKITGGPGWLQSDFYSIAAKADGPAPVEVMIGPDDAGSARRFKLKVHSETREDPVYSMTVGKNGLKIQPAV